MRPGRGFAYGRATADNAACGQPPVAAMARKIALGPGGSFEFTMVIGKLPDSSDGCLPPSRRLVELGKYLVASRRAKALAQLRERYRRLFERRRIDTPDAGLSRYANEFLPLQAYWVSMLDRGWPGGFRGTRDAAQDTTSMIGIDPGLARERLIELFSQQRSDGWFPRAYYPGDKTGKAFTATHVDAGVWVWELLREYLCLTRDFDVLKVKTPWMDRQGAASILDRSLGLLDYYLAKENLGPHGLCKIRGGDWNDAVNLAGLEGKGESVMVSCQLVLALEQAADLLRSLAKGRGGALLRRAGRLAVRAGTMRDCLLGHARNRAGYFNGVFSDGGYWVFSPRDPDGRRRISVPANAFAVIAGIVQGAGREEVFDALNELKGPHGWRLFYPAVGDRPIAKLGRIGQGDLAAGVGENGTIYNHGSHGFLGRAAAAAGKGDLLYDVMRHMLPYDQQAHDVAVTRTAPYGVVNHWKSAIGLEGVGGDVFLSGSIATALRNLYEGMAGCRSDVSHLVIDPCLPSHWAGIEAEVDFLGGRCRLRVANPAGVSCGVAALLLDGVAVPDRLDCRRTGRSLAAIPLAMIRPGRDHLIEVTMGGPA
ncbi:MAG: hypothetical protein NTV86_18230 [Planctomycetota bacterium]|nr:hypothetical protein [Planctomycetota bacterium]